MSRVDNDEIRNPAAIFLEWNGEKGHFKYYDKEKQENIPVKLPISFMILDICTTVKGFRNSDEGGIWSNEINKKSPSQILSVRTKKGIIAQGTWKDISAKVKAAGGEYAKCVYIAYKHEGEICICGLILKGAALKAFFDFSKKNDVYKGSIQIKGFEEANKGKVTYRFPLFSQKLDIKQESEDIATALTNELGEYHAIYFQRNANAKPVEAKEEAASATAQKAVDSTSGKSGRVDNASKNTVKHVDVEGNEEEVDLDIREEMEF